MTMCRQFSSSLVDDYLDFSYFFSINNTGMNSLAYVSLETWAKASILKRSLLKEGIRYWVTSHENIQLY